MSVREKIPAELASRFVDVQTLPWEKTRDKLEDDGQPRLIQTVRGVGYALREA